MSEPRAFLLIVAAWALIYLPGLGSREIKGEEGRRILPAITMLQTGNFIVPHVGSDPYFTKPPLVNWLVAGSFKLFGVRNEWTARIPSALSVLLVALAFATVARASLGADGSIAAALIWLTNFGMIEKGRLIEIEALYVSLTGLAFIFWLSWWQTGKTPWLTWTVPWLFLGLGWLAKGPLHLLFFYAVVISVLFRLGKLNELWNAAHLAGVMIMLGIFAVWAIPLLQLMQQNNVAEVWTRQFSGRLSGEDFKLSGWIMNVPRGLGYSLPWVLLLVTRKRSEPALFWGIAIPFFAVNLLPGALPRYTMPLLAPASWLAAVLLLKRANGMRLAFVVTGLTTVALLAYGFAITPRLKKREKVRPIAEQINATLPADEPLYAVDPDYQPFLFYVRDPIVYLGSVSEVPQGARYVLVQPRDQEQVGASGRWTIEEFIKLRDYRNKETLLLKVRD